MVSYYFITLGRESFLLLGVSVFSPLSLGHWPCFYQNFRWKKHIRIGLKFHYLKLVANACSNEEMFTRKIKCCNFVIAVNSGDCPG